MSVTSSTPSLANNEHAATLEIRQQASTTRRGLSVDTLLRFLPWLMGFVVVGSVVALATLTRPAADADETGLFNPVYMFIHTGRMTYPIYYNWDMMVVHPPVHYIELALLTLLGMSFAYAEAVPAIVFSAAVVLLINTSRMDIRAKVALQFGYFAALAINIGPGQNALHGVRPDVHVAIAWFAGLVALESGRLANWHTPRLALGAFLLTYASGIHYFGAIAFLGVAVYLAWVTWSLRWGAIVPVVAMMAGGLAFGVPYLVLFVLPDRAAILQMTGSVQQSGGVTEALSRHFAQYQFTDTLLVSRLEWPSLSAWFMHEALAHNIPLLLVALPVLLLSRSTRGIALAALPLPLFVMFYSQAKSAGYYVPEYMLYLSSVALLCFGILELAVSRLSLARVRKWAMPVLTLLLVADTASSTMHVDKIGSAQIPLVHPMDVARAAGKQMLGNRALVAGRIGMWYASGADGWWEVESDLLWRNLGTLDIRKYAAQFDAIADQYHMSNATSNDREETLSSWYAEGILGLRGFYFDTQNRSDLSYMLLDAVTGQSVTGYAHNDNSVVQFQQSDAGDAVFSTLVCPSGVGLDIQNYPDSYVNWILLPPRYAGSTLMSLLAPVREFAAARQGPLATCTTREEIPGTTEVLPTRQLISTLARDDRTMSFYRSAASIGMTTTVTFDPQQTAGVGDTVRVGLSVSSERSPVVSATLSINDSPDGSATGEWTVVGTQPVSSEVDQSASFVWKTAGMERGMHLVAINLDLADGRTVWWYDQPPVSYSLK